MKRSIIGAAVAIIVVAALVGAGWWILSGNAGAEYYTRIDNSKVEEVESNGGVIDFTGGMGYSYTLPCYDTNGGEHQLSFGTERELREGAYLKLEVEPIRGVIGWSEIQFDDLPPQVQAIIDG